MIVCECLALTEGQVRKKLDVGACRLSDLVPKSVLEGSCGACFQQLKAMMQDYKESKQNCGASVPTGASPSLAV